MQGPRCQGELEVVLGSARQTQALRNDRPAVHCRYAHSGYNPWTGALSELETPTRGKHMAESPAHFASPLSKRLVPPSHHRGQSGGMLCGNATYASALGNAVVRRPSCRRTANVIVHTRARTEEDVTVAVGDAENNTAHVLRHAWPFPAVLEVFARGSRRAYRF